MCLTPPTTDNRQPTTDNRQPTTDNRQPHPRAPRQPPPDPRITYNARRIYQTGDNMAGNLIDYRVEKGVAILELNDPPANTYTYEMNKELDTCILNARMDDDVYVIVLRGSGDKFFSAGANIKMLSEVTVSLKNYFCLHANETL